MDYKESQDVENLVYEETETREPNEDGKYPIDFILNQLINSYDRYLKPENDESFLKHKKDLINYISMVNQYLRTSSVEIQYFNSMNINILLMNLLSTPELELFYDSIMHILKTLVLLPDFIISPLEDKDFFRHIFFKVSPLLKYPDNGIILLASILDSSDKLRNELLDSEIISRLLQDSFDNKSIRRAAFYFFASAIRTEILDELLLTFIKEISSFFICYMIDKTNSPQILYECLSILCQRTRIQYFNYLVSHLNFTPLMENFKGSEKYDQKNILQILQLLLELDNPQIKSQIDIGYFKTVFTEKVDFESDDSDINESIWILFYKISAIMFKTGCNIVSFGPFLDEIFGFSLFLIENSNFKIKVEIFNFLSKIIPVVDSVLPIMLKSNYIQIFAQCLECDGGKIKEVIIMLLLYILHTVPFELQCDVFQEMEDSEVYKKINQIDVNGGEFVGSEEKMMYLIEEFNSLYNIMLKSSAVVD